MSNEDNALVYDEQDWEYLIADEEDPELVGRICQVYEPKGSEYKRVKGVIRSVVYSQNNESHRVLVEIIEGEFRGRLWNYTLAAVIMVYGPKE